MSGAGLTGTPSSAQTSASIAPARPSDASVRTVGSRSSLVATAIRRPPRPKPSEQGRQIRQRMGEADRIGRVPGRVERLLRRVDASRPRRRSTSSVRSRRRAIGVAARPPPGRTAFEPAS